MANPFIGRKINVGIGKEAVRGTGVSPSFWLPYSNCTFQERAEKTISEVGYSHIAQHGTAVLVDQFAEGTIEGEVRSESFGLLLLALFGEDTVGSYADSGYEHVYTLQNDNLHDSLTIAYKDDIRSIWFRRAMLREVEINIVPNDIVKFTAGFESLYPDDHSTWTSDYTGNGSRFRGRDLTFKIANDTSSLSGASPISLKSLRLSFIKELYRDNVCGTLGAEDIYNTIFRIEGEAILNFTSETYLDYAHLDGEKAMSVDLTNADSRVGDGSGRASLYFEFPKVVFTQWERGSDLDDIVSQTLNFEAVYDPSVGSLISNCYLRNDTPSY